MDTTLDVREYTDELLGTTTPADPAAYLDALIEANETRAKRLREDLSGTENQRLQEQVGVYIDDLLENADHARSRIEGADFGTFDVISPVLDYNYDKKVNDLRQLGERYDDDLTSEERTAVRELLEALTMFGVLREYNKSLYLQ
jgi:hypothetical protein